MHGARPKDELTAFDVLVLAEELAGLSGSYIDKILQPREDDLVFRLKRPGGDRRELVSERGKWVFLRVKEEGEGAPPPAFAMLLRKHLENRRIRSVAQHGFERILVVGAEDGYELVLELFGEGNIVLVKDGTVVQPLRNQSWEHRELRAGRSYLFPPARIDPRELDEARFAKLLAASKGDLVRTLAVSLNLGGRYAEEVCTRTGLDRNLKVGKLSQDDVHALRSAVDGIFARICSERRPTLYLDGDMPVDFAPISLEVDAALAAKPYPDLNAVIVDYARYWRDRKMEQERSGRVEDEAQRLQRQAQNQQKALEAFRKEAADCRRYGEAVLRSIDTVTDILARVEALRRTSGWTGVQKAVSGNELVPAIEARPHEGAVLVRLIAGDGNEVELLLDIRRKPRDNATRFFSDSKEAFEKARRTAGQLEESRMAVERLARDGLPGTVSPKEARKSRKVHWFERYRWFLSSDGNTVIGGRDAASNDRIVKRHLGEGDAYAHADFHGAPSVVVKRGRGEIPERTLREACIFALAMSKAWSAGIASGSAYWVHPDQVSKTPESGEFVPRGGFIVRGRKNRYDDLQLRLAIGYVEIEGTALLMCGPESAFSSRAAKFIAIQPGDEEPRAFAKRTSAELGCGAEEVARLLPTGKSQMHLPG